MKCLANLALGALLAACSGGGGGTPAGPTKADLEAAKAKVHGFQPWDQAEEALKGDLGEPTSMEGDAWVWIGRDGDACVSLTVTKMAKTVGTVTLDTTECP